MRHADAATDDATHAARSANPAGNPELSHGEILRYSRHLIMPEVGLAGQVALKRARVLVVGAGGLGSPLAMYLAAAGVGTLGIVDFDAVEATNLQRQIIHGTADVGRSKLDSATDALRAINPGVRVIGHPVRLSSANALDILADYDIVVDGTDNFPTRYLINDACVLLGKANVYGSIYRFDGQATVFGHAGGPCYRCLYPEPPPPGLVPSCAEGGVLGILPGVVGLIQATETVKLILGVGEPLVGRLLLYDALGMRFRELKIRRDPACPVCGDAPTVRALIDYEAFCGLTRPGPSGSGAHADGRGDDTIEPEALAEMMRRGERVVVLDVREPHEHQINRIPGARLIPLHDLPGRVQELEAADLLVVHCLSGARSAEACRFLRGAGFGKVRDLRGGIRAWIERVDPSLAQY